MHIQAPVSHLSQAPEAFSLPTKQSTGVLLLVVLFVLLVALFAVSVFLLKRKLVSCYEEQVDASNMKHKITTATNDQLRAEVDSLRTTLVKLMKTVEELQKTSTQHTTAIEQHGERYTQFFIDLRTVDQRITDEAERSNGNFRWAENSFTAKDKMIQSVSDESKIQNMRTQQLLEEQRTDIESLKDWCDKLYEQYGSVLAIGELTGEPMKAIEQGSQDHSTSSEPSKNNNNDLHKLDNKGSIPNSQTSHDSSSAPPPFTRLDCAAYLALPNKKRRVYNRRRREYETWLNSKSDKTPKSAELDPSANAFRPGAMPGVKAYRSPSTA